jgi:hypothetical protein
MIIFVENYLKNSGKILEIFGTSKWVKYLMNHGEAHSIMFEIYYGSSFYGSPYEEKQRFPQAVSVLKQAFPQIPAKEIERYIKFWLKEHEDDV